MEGRSRGRLSGLAIAALGFAMIFTVTYSPAAPAEQRGTFALLGSAPKILAESSTTYAPGRPVTLSIREFLPDGTPILKYDVDMQRLMHLVVVRDDFATFEHLHPNFVAANGTFSQTFATLPNHRYYAYADTTPHGIGQQVFRFAIGAPFFAPRPSSGPSPKNVAAGPYSVALAQTTLSADRAQTLELAIYRDRKLAQDLGTYLGAAAHAVFINTFTLEYVHVHAMSRGAAARMGPSGSMSMNSSAGPKMRMVIPALSNGVYKLWIQFRGGDTIYTAPFTILVR